MARNWKDLKVTGKYVLVKADPRVKKTAGGIILTDELTGIERVMEGSGKVLGVGRDVATVLGEELPVGSRICYRGFLKDVYKDLCDKEDDCDIFMLRAEDVMAVLGEETQVGYFSGPAKS